MSPRTPHRDFVLLCQGQLVSQLGSQVGVIALMFWVMDATDSASLLGLLLLLSGLPAVLLGPLGGTFADRHSRRAILVGSNLANGLLASLVAALLWLRPGALELLVGLLGLVAVVGGASQAFFRPAVGATIPDLVPVERLASANSIFQVALLAALILGQALGGVLYAALGAAAIFALDALTFFHAAASASLMRLPRPPTKRLPQPMSDRLPQPPTKRLPQPPTKRLPQPPTERLPQPPTDQLPQPMSDRLPQPLPARQAGLGEAARSYARDTQDGVRYVWRRKGLRQLLLAFGVANFCAGPVAVLFPFYVRNSLARGAEWYGFLMAAAGTGAIAGFALVGRLRIAGRTASGVVTGAMLGACALLALAGQLTNPVHALVVFFTLGLLVALVQIFVRTLVQATTPSALRGRTVALVATLSAGLAPLGMALGGLLADLTGKNVPLLFGLSGAASGLAILAAALRRDFWEFLASSAPASGPPSGLRPSGEAAEDL